MHWGESLSFKATAAPAAAAVVVTPHVGRRRQCPCSTEFYGWRSQSSYSKPPSISPRGIQRIILRATKDDDPIAEPATDEPYMPEEWPDFSKKISFLNVRKKFFNRSREYSMLLDYLNDEPSKPLLLLGPINSGKSVRPVVGS
jgi:hypothetical protein